MKRTPLKRTGGLKRSPFKPKKKNDPEWQRARARVLKRCGGRCEARWEGCAGAAHHVHHMKRRSQGGTHDVSNLLACCFLCHNQIHSNIEKARKLGHLKN